MTSINIGRSIKIHRKKKKMTQEELGYVLGISKSSISKWENNQAMPDIVMLPELASFFKISMDELLGYEPQLTSSEMREYYQYFSHAFLQRDFFEVKVEIEELLKKYSASFSFQLYMGILLLNHYMVKADPVIQQENLKELLVLFEQIKRESPDAILAKHANSLQASVYAILEDYEMVLQLLGTEVIPYSADEQIQANAHAKLGNLEKGKEILQVQMYQHLLAFIADSGQYIHFLTDDLEKIDQTINRTLRLFEVYQIAKLAPFNAISFLLEVFIQYLEIDEITKALAIFDQLYTILISKPKVVVKGDDYFELIANWLENQTVLGTTIPREESFVFQSVLQVFTDYPLVKEKLTDELDYQEKVQQLNKLLGSVAR